MAGSINAGKAMIDVLRSWGVRHVYGMPGSSINSTMDALYHSRNTVKYIQVRHEEVGALAAAAAAKLTGRVGVCFGSGGPGATHLFNGLYDAKMDSAPVLALVGQVASAWMNFDSFQELNENPMFADVSVYNRTAMTPQSLPHLIDEGIRMAYEHRGVSVVTVPVDFPARDIPAGVRASSAQSHRSGFPMPDEADIEEAVKLIAWAKRPVLYVGRGAQRHGDEVAALSRHCSMPVITSVMAKGLVPDSMENYLGSAARVATKPANEALAAADLILFIGSDFPFANQFFPKTARMIQVDIDSSKLGRRHFTDVAILGDAAVAMRKLREGGQAVPVRPFLAACRRNMRIWKRYLAKLAESSVSPLRVEPVFREINRIAGEDAVFITDVGNSLTHAIRNLDMNGKQRFSTSGMFATMGYGVPGGIAAKLNFPESQVFTLSGDGAFAMVMQDIVTQAKYNLPVINVVFSNKALGFVEAIQEDSGQEPFGVDLEGVDFAKAAEAMGAAGFTVTKAGQLPKVFDAAKRSKVPVVIDVKVGDRRPFPAESFALDPEAYSAKEIAEFKKRYSVGGMPVLRELME